MYKPQTYVRRRHTWANATTHLYSHLFHIPHRSRLTQFWQTAYRVSTTMLSYTSISTIQWWFVPRKAHCSHLSRLLINCQYVTCSSCQRFNSVDYTKVTENRDECQLSSSSADAETAGALTAAARSCFLSDCSRSPVNINIHIVSHNSQFMCYKSLLEYILSKHSNWIKATYKLK